jgi:hypothetical protein
MQIRVPTVRLKAYHAVSSDAAATETSGTSITTSEIVRADHRDIRHDMLDVKHDRRDVRRDKRGR